MVKSQVDNVTNKYIPLCDPMNGMCKEHNRLNLILKLWKERNSGILFFTSISIWMVILKNIINKNKNKLSDYKVSSFFGDYTYKEAIY